MQGNMVGYFSSIQPFLTCGTEDANFQVNYLQQVFKELDARTYALWHEQIDAMPQTLASTHPRDSAALLFAGSWFLSTGQQEKSMQYFRPQYSAQKFHTGQCHMNSNFLSFHY